jgi:hypothetical protein
LRIDHYIFDKNYKKLKDNNIDEDRETFITTNEAKSLARIYIILLYSYLSSERIL